MVRSITSQLQKAFNNEQVRIVPVYLSDEGGYWHYNYVPEESSENKYEIVKLGKDDIFLGLDLNSNVVQAVNGGMFEAWQSVGVKIMFVVYDILPILNPHWWPIGVSNGHKNWLNTVLKISNTVVCISRSVQSDVQNYARMTNFIEKLPEIEWFHLGADIQSSKPSAGISDEADELIEKLKNTPSFLMVGTIEPRKGHQQCMDAFDKLWNQGLDVNLIIVGKQGWMVEELANRLHMHPLLNDKLFWLSGISDEYLEAIYKSSTCLILASEGEGFGLPLIEAAQYGLPVIARDIPVFREVASGYAEYFDGLLPSDIAQTVIDWLEKYDSNTHNSSSGLSWLTWEESAENLKHIILR